MIKIIAGIIVWCARTFRCVSSIGCWLVLSFLLTACGGGSGSKNSAVSTSQLQVQPSSVAASSFAVSSVVPSSSSSKLSANSIATSSVSSQGTQKLSGRISYDFIPHYQNAAGLNYGAIEVRPVRGALVELLNSAGRVVAVSSTNELGDYRFDVSPNNLVQVRVRAQLVAADSVNWTIKVTDNTANNALYSMAGSLVTTGLSDSRRDLHAVSGWDGNGYSGLRVAAPFAILDTLFEGYSRLQREVGTFNFSGLELRWSVKNKAAEGIYSLGEIGTSFFNGQAIYLLGDENNDTDEYDPSVILHEWSHYLESEISRSDSLGGDHRYGDKLDMRVAMSEGYANAMAGMILNDPLYRDSSSHQQFSGYSYLLSKKDHVTKGWYSESSIESLLYNFYTSSFNKPAADLSDIMNVMTSSRYSGSDSLISIFLFSEVMRTEVPEHYELFKSLLTEQKISGDDQYGAGESNAGGSRGDLPVYKLLSPQGGEVNVCSSNHNGAYNKLSNNQFFRIVIAVAGNYRLSIVSSDTNDAKADPDVFLFRKGVIVAQAKTQDINTETLSKYLTEGTYILEVYDARIKDVELTELIKSCFNVSISPI